MTSHFPKISGMNPPIKNEIESILCDMKGQAPVMGTIGSIVDEMLLSTQEIQSIPPTPMKRKVSQVSAFTAEEGSPTKKPKNTLSGRIEFGSAHVSIQNFSGELTINSGESSISINSNNSERPLPNFNTPEEVKRPTPSFSLVQKSLNSGIIPQFPSGLSKTPPTPSKVPLTPSKKPRPGLSPNFPKSNSSIAPSTPLKSINRTPRGQEKLYAIYERLSLTPLDTPAQLITLSKDIKTQNGVVLISKDKPLNFIGQGASAFVYRQGDKVIKLPIPTLSDKLLQRNLTRTINGYEQLNKIEVKTAETFIIDDMIIAEYVEGSEPSFNDVVKYFNNMFKSPSTHFIADFKPQNLKFADQRVICIDPTTLKDHVPLNDSDFNSMVMELVMVFKEWQKKEEGLDVRRYFDSESYQGVGKDLYNQTMERLFNSDPED